MIFRAITGWKLFKLNLFDLIFNFSYDDSLKEFEETTTTTTSIRIFDQCFDRGTNRYHSFSGFRDGQQIDGRNNKKNRSFMYPNNLRWNFNWFFANFKDFNLI